MDHPRLSIPPTEASELQSEADTHLHGRWLAWARWLCIALCVLAAAFYTAGVRSYIVHDFTFCTGPAAACLKIGNVVVPPGQGPGLSREAVGIFSVIRDTIFSLVYWLVAAFLLWRKPDDRMALLAAVSLGIFPIAFNIGFISTLPSPWWFPAKVVSFIGSISFPLFYYTFPGGRFAPRWIRVVFALVLLYRLLNTFFPTAPFNPISRSPLYSDLIFFGLVGSWVAVQIYRYRQVSSPTQRQQTKWIVYGISMGWSVYLSNLVLSLFFPVLNQTGPLVTVLVDTAVYLFLLLIPLAIGFAVARARLWDIDLVINRTLVYAGLTACIAGVYILVVGSLGALIGTGGNLLVDLLATGLVAILLQPLRERVQRGMNHLLYGQRDEPYTVITRLSQRLEGTLAPEAILPTIVETIAQALKLPYAAILLKQDDTFRLSASAGALVGEPLVLPLVYRKEMVGQMHLAPRAPGEALSVADQRLLDELARQAGLAAHAVKLTEDLQRSHEQLEQRVVERTRELSSLLEISHTVASTLQLKPLLGLILDQLKLVVNYTGASILTVDGNDLVFLDSRNPVPQGQLAQLRFPITDLGLVWQILHSGEAVIVPDIFEETPLAQAVRAAMGDLRETIFHYVHAWMAVPLILRDQAIGMLVLSSDQERAFTQRHATLALAIANQAAVAIENAHLYEQAQELAALEERQKLARELHDSVSQILYGISLGVHTARALQDREPGLVAEQLDDVLGLTKAGLAEMRALIFELRPESLATEGLVSALAKQAAALQARHELPVEAELCDEPDLPLRVKQELYRVAQEALHNTIKHAHASQVNLRLGRTAEAIILEVRDNGVGFRPQDSFPGHIGLVSMRERLENLGGVLSLESTPGQGSVVHAAVPVSAMMQFSDQPTSPGLG